MNIELSIWQSAMVWGTVLLLGVAVAYRIIERLRARRQAHRRIVAARVRSGHVPLEIPTVRGGLGSKSRQATQWGDLDDGEDEDHVVVDEQPRIRIQYIDFHGRPTEHTVQVERLDLYRQAIVSRAELVDDVRIYPLQRITAAYNAATGKPFNLGLWVDAVRVARRRRETQMAME